MLAANEHADEIEPDAPVSASAWEANLPTHERLAIVGEDDESHQPWMVGIGPSGNGRRRILDEIQAFASK